MLERSKRVVWTRALAWLGAVLFFGTLLFTYRHLAALAEGSDQHWLEPFINEMSSAFGAGGVFFMVRALVHRFPLDGGGWRRHLPHYLLAMVLVSVALTSWRWGVRSLLYPLAGFGPYDYGRMPLRYFMEFPLDLQGFWLFVAVFHIMRRLRAARERQLRTAQLETALARAQVSNLRLQLQPHFLFNALNTVSATMYRDPGAADEMIDRLGELLRMSLRTAKTDEVPLRTEMETLECYLDIMRARYGGRLEVAVRVEPGIENALVPSMILQPLVENAVRHGNAERTGHGRIDVHVQRCGDMLAMRVEDDGPGVAGEVVGGTGVGLTAARERLQLLYGDRQTFSAANGIAGGFRVSVKVPFRVAESGA